MGRAQQEQLAQQAGIFSWLSSLSAQNSLPQEELQRLQRKELRKVEEMREQILALMHTEQVDVFAFAEELERVETATREVLRGTFSQFPRAWAKASDAVRLELWDLLDSA